MNTTRRGLPWAAGLAWALASMHAAQALPMPVAVSTSPTLLRVGEAFTITVNGVIALTPTQGERRLHEMPGPKFAGDQFWTSYDWVQSTEVLDWAAYQFQSSDGQKGTVTTFGDPRMQGQVSFTFQTPGTYWLTGTWFAASDLDWQMESHDYRRFCLFWICGDWAPDGVRNTRWSTPLPPVGPLTPWAAQLTVRPAVEEVQPTEQPLPEPGSLPLAGAAWAALALAQHRRRQQPQPQPR
ncbi:hypothetical protein [Roseateles sp. BYS87W]|uniref:PEP-CTERM sorting domain-containing protein n=1 Tax=Pelomonas baiyunensis TaxID=3299026 RepID=A0ABW7H014_9BURK